MINRHKETLKKLRNSRNEEQRLKDVMIDHLYRSILNGHRVQADILAKAFKIIFPKSNMVVDAQFRALWKLGHYLQATKLYQTNRGKIFWYSERVVKFYERQGQRSKGIEEMEFLMTTYAQMGKKGILPLPNGPRQLFFLGRWYADKNASKSRNFLELYLNAERIWRSDPSLALPYKNQARRILNRLERSRELGYVV